VTGLYDPRLKPLGENGRYMSSPINTPVASTSTHNVFQSTPSWQNVEGIMENGFNISVEKTSCGITSTSTSTSTLHPKLDTKNECKGESHT
jgi:hypothetical protein